LPKTIHSLIRHNFTTFKEVDVTQTAGRTTVVEVCHRVKSALKISFVILKVYDQKRGIVLMEVFFITSRRTQYNNERLNLTTILVNVSQPVRLPLPVRII